MGKQAHASGAEAAQSEQELKLGLFPRPGMSYQYQLITTVIIIKRGILVCQTWIYFNPDNLQWINTFFYQYIQYINIILNSVFFNQIFNSKLFFLWLVLLYFRYNYLQKSWCRLEHKTSFPLSQVSRSDPSNNVLMSPGEMANQEQY